MGDYCKNCGEDLEEALEVWILKELGKKTFLDFCGWNCVHSFTRPDQKPRIKTDYR